MNQRYSNQVVEEVMKRILYNPKCDNNKSTLAPMLSKVYQTALDIDEFPNDKIKETLRIGFFTVLSSSIAKRAGACCVMSFSDNPKIPEDNWKGKIPDNLLDISLLYYISDSSYCYQTIRELCKKYYIS